MNGIKRMSNINDPFDTLNKTFSAGRNSAKSSFRHEREDHIIDQLRFVMKHSDTAQALLDFADNHNIQIHVLKNKEDFGFIPEGQIVYIAATPNERIGTPEMLINLIGALREAQQEQFPETRRPTLDMGEERYVQHYVDKKADIHWHQCQAIEEIEKSLGFTEIVDSFRAMGYSEILEAYKKDKESSEEIV